MTEDNAKKLWCPMAVVKSEHVSYNRNSFDDAEDFGPDKDKPSQSQTCWGSHCALWTWNTGSSIEGYCGLRGKVVIP